MSSISSSNATIRHGRRSWFVFFGVLVTMFSLGAYHPAYAETCGEKSLRRTKEVIDGCIANNPLPSNPRESSAQARARRQACTEAGIKEVTAETKACGGGDWSCQQVWDQAQNEALEECRGEVQSSADIGRQLGATEADFSTAVQHCTTEKMKLQESVADCEKRLKEQSIAGYWTCFITYEANQNTKDIPKTACLDLRAKKTGLGKQSMESVGVAQGACYAICDDAELRPPSGLPNPVNCEFIRTLGCKDESTLATTANARLKEQEFKIQELRQLTADIPRFKGNSIPEVIGSIVSVALGILGSIAFALFVYGGVLWMISAGGDRQAKAMKIITWTALGLIVVLASYVITEFILQSFIIE